MGRLARPQVPRAPLARGHHKHGRVAEESPHPGHRQGADRARRRRVPQRLDRPAGRPGGDAPHYPLFYNPDPMPRPVNPWELIFNFPQIRDRFADVIARWVALQEPYESVMGLFFGTLYQQASYRE